MSRRTITLTLTDRQYDALSSAVDRADVDLEATGQCEAERAVLDRAWDELRTAWHGHRILRFTRGDRNRIARALWEKDGEPDGHAPGEVHRGSYESWAHDVIQAITDAGWDITRTTPRSTHG